MADQNADYELLRDTHLVEMEAWASGDKSIWNTAESREQAEMFDAACVVRHAAAAMAYGFLAALEAAQIDSLEASSE